MLMGVQNVFPEFHYSFSSNLNPKPVIPPTQPVAISLKPWNIPMQESIPKTIMLAIICGLSVPHFISISYDSKASTLVINSFIAINATPPKSLAAIPITLAVSGFSPTPNAV